VLIGSGTIENKKCCAGCCANFTHVYFCHILTYFAKHILTYLHIRVICEITNITIKSSNANVSFLLNGLYSQVIRILSITVYWISYSCIKRCIRMGVGRKVTGIAIFPFFRFFPFFSGPFMNRVTIEQ
jgi:hypothetical protein